MPSLISSPADPVRPTTYCGFDFRVVTFTTMDAKDTKEP